MAYNVSTQDLKVGACMAFDQNKYIQDYVKENYDRVELRMPKGKKNLLKTLATQHGITDDKGKVSVSRMVIECIEEKYGIDLSKPD